MNLRNRWAWLKATGHKVKFYDSFIQYWLFIDKESENNLPEAGTLHLANSQIDFTESQFIQVEPESKKFPPKNVLPTIEE